MTQWLDRIRPPWLDGYDSNSLARDALTGAILSVLLVPQAMAYASLAGLAPGVGLLTAMVAPLLYAVFGQVAVVSVGPVALASLLVADSVGASDIEPPVAAAIIAIEVGAMLTLLGIVKMGRLVNFVSEPALLGFTAAAAFLIAASQASGLLGIEAERAGNLPDALARLWRAGGIDPATAAIGLLALLGFLFGEGLMIRLAHALRITGTARLAIQKSAQLLVIALATVVAVWLLPSVERVPRPEAGLPRLTLPAEPLSVWLSLLIPSLIVAVVVFVTGSAVAKSLSSRRRKALDSSRESLAIGASNVVAGLFGGYAAGVSLSRSALVHDVGGRSPLATVFGGLIVLPVTLFAGDLLAQMPQAALAALVMSAVVGLVKLSEMLAVGRHSRLEGAVILVTFLATLGFGVQWGLLAGALSGIASFLWSSSLPRVTREGRDPRSDQVYRSVSRDDVISDTGPVLVVRIDRPLYFGNVGHAEDEVSRIVADHPEAEYLVLDMRAVTDVDATGLRMLNRLLDNADEKKLRVAFAALTRPLEDALCHEKSIEECEHYETVSAAVAGIQTARGEWDGWEDGMEKGMGEKPRQ